MPTITQIEIRNFGGIRQLKVKVPAKGLVVKGGNHRGKTSFIGAVEAALMAEGVDAGAIRHGADKSEIFLDLDQINEYRHIHRTIRPGSQDVVITNDQEDTKPRPAEFLKSIFGKSINPVSFYMAKADERRRLVLEAMQCEVTAADLERWTGRSVWSDSLLVENGLVLLKKVRDDYYERRRIANKESDEAAEDARRARSEADMVEASLPLRVAVPLEEAKERWTQANQKVLELDARIEASKAAETSQAATRAKIVRLRGEADTELADTPAVLATVMKMHQEAFSASASRIECLRFDLARAEESHKAIAEQLKEIEKTASARAAAEGRSRNLREQASDLEANLNAAGAVLAVGAGDFEARRAQRDEAAADLAHAEKRSELATANGKAAALETIADTAKETADGLDRIVTRLTKEAPLELAARGGSIQGFDAETMTLDGTPLNRLSGEEQLRFAVELAKRVNPKSKLLICDGIERVEVSLEPRFLELATADGWQLIATRVTEGKLSIEAIGES